MREKRDPALIGGEPLIVEIALWIRRDDPDSRIARARSRRRREPGTSSIARTD